MGIFKYAEGSEPKEDDKAQTDEEVQESLDSSSEEEQEKQGPGDIIEGGQSFESSQAQSTFSSRVS